MRTNKPSICTVFLFLFCLFVCFLTSAVVAGVFNIKEELYIKSKLNLLRALSQNDQHLLKKKKDMIIPGDYPA